MLQLRLKNLHDPSMRMDPDLRGQPCGVYKRLRLGVDLVLLQPAVAHVSACTSLYGQHEPFSVLFTLTNSRNFLYYCVSSLKTRYEQKFSSMTQ
jgi:hypothetical protein